MAGKGPSHASRINPSKYYSSEYWDHLEKSKLKKKPKKGKTSEKKDLRGKR